MDTDSSGPDELARLRAERDEWRRRAEVAEAVAAERLARAEAAERAVTAADAALHSLGQVTPGGTTVAAQAPAAADESEPVPPRPRSLIERWRRYTDTINRPLRPGA